MASENNNNRSYEANEILRKEPPWIAKGGIITLVIIFTVLILIAILVKYPDTIEGKVVLSTVPHPIKLKTETSGNISKIFAKDESFVTAGQYILEIDNPIGIEKINELADYVSIVDSCTQQFDLDLLAKCSHQHLSYLGEAQPMFNELVHEVTELVSMHKEKIYDDRLDFYRTQKRGKKNISKISKESNEMRQEGLERAREKYESYKQLYEERVISKLELFREQEVYQNILMAYNEREKQDITNKFSILETEKAIMELEYEFEEKEHHSISNIVNLIKNIRNYILVWEQQNLIVAPFDGQLFFAGDLQVNQPVVSAEYIATVIPQNRTYEALAYFPASGFGKVKNGQDALLYLDNFPQSEFGYIESEVAHIGYLPVASEGHEGHTESYHKVYIDLDTPLLTTHNIQIPFKPELTGTAKVITEDKSLFERLILKATKF